MNTVAHRLACASFVAAITTTAIATSAAAPPGRYTAVSGAVLDTKTNLTWQLATTSLPQTQAASYCQGLSGGPWRVPTMKELLTLVDYSTSFPAIDATFTDTPSGPFWSSTLTFGETGLAWYVSFADGSWSQDSLGNAHSIRCVK